MKNIPLLFACLTLIGCDESSSLSVSPPSTSVCQKTWLDPSEHIHPNTDIFEFSKKEDDTALYLQYSDNETVSIPYTETSLLHQMDLLVKAGMFVQTANLINQGDINLSGFFKDEVNVLTNVPEMGFHTRKANGGQYVLTDKGKKWFIIDKDSQGFFVCIGVEKEVEKEERITSDGMRVITETRYTLENTPDWYTGELITAIPKIKNEIDMGMNASVVSTSKIIRHPTSSQTEQH